jgi:hypothetical protein
VIGCDIIILQQVNMEATEEEFKQRVEKEASQKKPEEQPKLEKTV